MSVLATGDLLLDGQQVTLAELEQAMDQAAKDGAAIWYYREHGAGEPPPVAMEVLKLVTRNKLPIRLSSKPDFSDTVTPALPDLEQVFAPIRQKASQRQLVIVRPDVKVMLLPALEKTAAPPEALASIERMLPSDVKRNVAVVTATAWAAAAAPSIQSANEAIPFFGILMGFASIGHAVWIFDTKAAAILSAGCRDADIVVVDSARAETLPQGWQSTATKAMRNPQIMVYDRATGKMRRG